MPNRTWPRTVPGPLPVAALAVLAGLLAGCGILPHAILTAADIVRGEADAWSEAKEDVFGDKKDMSGRIYIARQIGRGITDGDARLLADAAAKTLEDGTTGRSFYWRSPTSDARAIMRPGTSAMEWRSLATVPEKGVARAPLAEIIGRPVRAVREAQFRVGPGLGHDVAGGLRPGETFVAIARAADTNWILIGRNGRAVGYLHLSAMGPVEGAGAFVSLREPTRPPRDTGMAESRLAAPSQCRALTYEVSVGGRRARKYRFRACRADQGGWQIAVPQIAAPAAATPPQTANREPGDTADKADADTNTAGAASAAAPRSMAISEPAAATDAAGATDARQSPHPEAWAPRGDQAEAASRRTRADSDPASADAATDPADPQDNPM